MDSVQTNSWPVVLSQLCLLTKWCGGNSQSTTGEGSTSSSSGSQQSVGLGYHPRTAAVMATRLGEQFQRANTRVWCDPSNVGCRRPLKINTNPLSLFTTSTSKEKTQPPPRSCRTSSTRAAASRRLPSTAMASERRLKEEEERRRSPPGLAGCAPSSTR